MRVSMHNIPNKSVVLAIALLVLTLILAIAVAIDIANERTRLKRSQDQLVSNVVSIEDLYTTWQYSPSENEHISVQPLAIHTYDPPGFSMDFVVSNSQGVVDDDISATATMIERDPSSYFLLILPDGSRAKLHKNGWFPKPSIYAKLGLVASARRTHLCYGVTPYVYRPPDSNDIAFVRIGISSEGLFPQGKYRLEWRNTNMLRSSILYSSDRMKDSLRTVVWLNSDLELHADK